MLFSGVALFFPAFLAYFLEENEFIYNFGFTGFITFIIGCFLFFLSSEKDGDDTTEVSASVDKDGADDGDLL